VNHKNKESQILNDPLHHKGLIKVFFLENKQEMGLLESGRIIVENHL